MVKRSYKLTYVVVRIAVEAFVVLAGIGALFAVGPLAAASTLVKPECRVVRIVEPSKPGDAPIALDREKLAIAECPARRNSVAAMFVLMLVLVPVRMVRLRRSWGPAGAD
jgi:hypothetical protein